jgi:hypothetical protein
VPHSPLRGVRENNELEINLFISTHVTHPARQLFYTLQTNPISAQTGFARNHKQTSNHTPAPISCYMITPMISRRISSTLMSKVAGAFAGMGIPCPYTVAIGI